MSSFYALRPVVTNHDTDQSRTNIQQAASRISDVDVAEEAGNLVRVTILQKAATAILAQANQIPGMVLKLLE